MGSVMGSTMPMGTSQGMGSVMGSTMQMGPPMQSAAPMQSATYGNLPGMQMPPPSTPQMGMARPVGTMPMMGQQPIATTASIPPMMQPAPPVAAPQQSMPTGWVPGVARPIMTSVAAPPVVGGLSQAPIQYGPSYNMSYYPRSTADKTAVKYTGFLPLEGVFEEDTCRIG